MNQKPPPRLPWQPHPEGGFIAYPEGREHPARFARMQPTAHGGYGVYTWSVHYDGQAISDLSSSKQAASDAANGAWPAVIEKAKLAGARSEWERNTLEMIAKAERGEIDPHYFANEAAKYENMMWVMDRIKPKPGYGAVSAGIQRIVDALSREFARRRTRR
jgi:hypothetical protein